LGNLKERAHFEELDVDGRILKRILKKQNGRPWNKLFWLRRRTAYRTVTFLRRTLLYGFI
jgi:hypothetical protein